MSLYAGERYHLPFFIDSVKLDAGTAIELVAPEDGYLVELRTTVAEAVTTGGTITAQVGTTNVAGLSITVANSAAAGTRASASATSGSATRKVAKGDRIRIVPSAAFATAGAVNGSVTLATADTSAAL